MKKKNWLILGISLLLCILLVLPVIGGCAKQAVPEQPKGEITIGILDDLSGPLAGVCGPRKDGVVDAVRYINEEKGGILGHPLKTIIVDHKMDTTLMSSGWERLKGEKALIVSSALGSLPPIAQPCAERQATRYLRAGRYPGPALPQRD